MPLAKCPRCEKLFDKYVDPVCVTCKDDESADHEIVREALAENENLNAEQLAELTGVGLPCVMRMLDSGTIKVVAVGDLVKCGKCGAPAISNSKKLCQKCLDKLNVEVMSAQREIKLGERKKIEIGEYSSARKSFEKKRR